MRLIALTLLMTTVLFANDQMDWSYYPPGGVSIEEAPMLVAFGWDDNAYADAMHWIVDFMDTLTNHDGSPARTSFFCTGGYATGEKQANNQTASAIAASWNKAYTNGHEIANHTLLHEPGSSGKDAAYWSSAITACNTALTTHAGVPADSIIGFRTPFLEYGDGTFEALKSLGFLYDCSIEIGFNWFEVQAGYSDPVEGWVSAIAYSTSKAIGGKVLWWPYTLENGPATGSSAKSQVTMAGMWEIPVCVYQEPTTPVADLNNISDDLSVRTITGFDYNVFKLMDTKEQFLDLLKFLLHQRMQGNKNPLTINTHTDYYSVDNATVNTPGAQDYFTVPYLERRWAIEEFIKYALQFPEVRLVPFKNIIDYMKAPLPSASYVAPTWSNNPTAAIPTSPQRQSHKRAQLNAVASHAVQLTIPKQGSYDITLHSVDGRVLFSKKGVNLSQGSQQIDIQSIDLRSHVTILTLSGEGVRTTSFMIK